MLINSSGNVTIGDADLAGTSAKLYVNGTVKFGTGSGCDVWLNRTNGYGYINAAYAFALTVNNNSSNIAMTVETDKSANFYGKVAMPELTLSNNKCLYFKDNASNAREIITLNSLNQLAIGRGNALQGSDTYIAGNNIYLKYGKNEGVAIGISYNGNVLVETNLSVLGTTTLSSTLTVGGQTTINNNLIVTGDVAVA
jgi:hypothetical protein